MLKKWVIHRRNAISQHYWSVGVQYFPTNKRSNSPKINLTYLTYEKALFVVVHHRHYCLEQL